ncbi:MAG: helix-turn-helix transcriptional regulator [Bacilli bacterium]|jgi:transcriptional regulator with XRE-family HTH domain|nr:helix-turn-helix transcriptional regulator [Bacilli bacterium]
MKLRNIVGINLKYYRYKSGLSQEKFYLGLELNPKYLAKVERGKANISFDYVEELAKKLKVHINDLILYNENHVIDKKRIDEKQKVNN